MMRQNAVYWAPSLSGPDSHGQPQYEPPVQLKVRWEDTNELYVAVTGEQQTSRAKVYVGQDVEPGGVIMLGALEDVTDIDRPKSNSNAWEIRSFAKTPNMKVTEYLRTVFV